MFFKSTKYARKDWKTLKSPCSLKTPLRACSIWLVMSMTHFEVRSGRMDMSSCTYTIMRGSGQPQCGQAGAPAGGNGVSHPRQCVASRDSQCIQSWECGGISCWQGWHACASCRTSCSHDNSIRVLFSSFPVDDCTVKPLILYLRPQSVCSHCAASLIPQPVGECRRISAGEGTCICHSPCRASQCCAISARYKREAAWRSRRYPKATAG